MHKLNLPRWCWELKGSLKCCIFVTIWRISVWLAFHELVKFPYLSGCAFRKMPTRSGNIPSDFNMRRTDVLNNNRYVTCGSTQNPMCLSFTQKVMSFYWLGTLDRLEPSHWEDVVRIKHIYCEIKTTITCRSHYWENYDMRRCWCDTSHGSSHMNASAKVSEYGFTNKWHDTTQRSQRLETNGARSIYSFQKRVQQCRTCVRLGRNKTLVEKLLGHLSTRLLLKLYHCISFGSGTLIFCVYRNLIFS